MESASLKSGDREAFLSRIPNPEYRTPIPLRVHLWLFPSGLTSARGRRMIDWRIDALCGDARSAFRGCELA